MSAIAGVMRSDWRILGFISALWAGVIRDYAPYPSPFQWHVNLPNFNFPNREEGTALAADPCSRPWGFTMDGGGGGEGGGGGRGQIRDAHELGMTSAVRSTLAVSAVSSQRISLINGHQGEGRPLFLVWYSEGLMGEFRPGSAMFKTCRTAASTLDSERSLDGKRSIWHFIRASYILDMCACASCSSMLRLLHGKLISPQLLQNTNVILNTLILH